MFKHFFRAVYNYFVPAKKKYEVPLETKLEMARLYLQSLGISTADKEKMFIPPGVTYVVPMNDVDGVIELLNTNGLIHFMKMIRTCDDEYSMFGKNRNHELREIIDKFIIKTPEDRDYISLRFGKNRSHQFRAAIDEIVSKTSEER